MEKLYVILMYVGLELQLCLLYGLCFPEWFCYLVINGGLNLAHFSGRGCTQMGYGVTATSLPHIIATSLPHHHQVSCHINTMLAATSLPCHLPHHCHISCHIITTSAAMSLPCQLPHHRHVNGHVIYEWHGNSIRDVYFRHKWWA